MSVAKPWIPALPAPATSHSLRGEPGRQFSAATAFAGEAQSAAATEGEPPSAAATSALSSATRATGETGTDLTILDPTLPPPVVRHTEPNVRPDNGATPPPLPRYQRKPTVCCL